MEDSYTVHRRRKAAARKREKTPDPVSKGAASRMDTTDDEDEERRARMERMADEAEKMDQQQKEKRLSQQQQQLEATAREPENANRERREEPELPGKEKRKERISADTDDMIAIRTKVAAKSTAGNSPKKTCEAVVIADDNNTRHAIKQVTGEATSKYDDGVARKETVVRSDVLQIPGQTTIQDTSETPKDTNDESGRPEVRKVERRFKRKSKERVDRYSRSTDSSDVDEKSESGRRKTKSIEAVRPRVKRTNGRSRIDPEAQNKDAKRLNREKRSSSRQKLEDESHARNNCEKSRSRSYSQAEDTDKESRVMRKSESFPQKEPVEERTIKRSSTELKKQIIPLSNDSLIEDFARAQREYMLRERNILDPEPEDIFQDAVEISRLRRRKFSVAQIEGELEIVQTVAQSSDTTDDKKKWLFSWLFWRGKKDDDATEKKIEDEPKLLSPRAESSLIKAEKRQAPEKVTLWNFIRAFKDVVGEFRAFVAQNPRQTRILRQLRNRCIAELLLVIIYCGLGAFVFRFVEGAFETFYKCGVKRVKRDFLDSLWNYSHNLREDDWKSMARRKLMEFEEQLHTAHEAGLHNYSGQKNWSFLNAVAYCLTVITTIGENNVSKKV